MFGYHEIFHVLVIAAAVLQYVAVAAYALPDGLIGQSVRASRRQRHCRYR